MADDVEMTPVASEPPKVNPFAAASGTGSTVKMNPTSRPATVGNPTATLKPGLKLPTQPGLKPGLKLPTKTGATAVLKPGLKLPPKPGATATMKPGLKLPTQTALKPGLKLPTQPGLKPGVRLPTKPVIRKPGATVVSTPLPKPVTVPKPVAPAAGETKSATVEAKPIASTPGKAPTVEAKPIASTPEKTPTVEATPVAPVPIDAQGVGKLPTVEMQAVDRAEAPKIPSIPKPLEQLKSVTQKLKGITQDIPQQAILRKTGIIADGSMSEAQKEAAKHKTARISLSDAMGVAPVKNENAPMKTIRIKRPIDIPGATAPLKPQAKPVTAPAASAVSTTEAETKPIAPATTTGASTITQRKTLKIARPGGGAVRPSGKFGVKRPSQMTTVAKPSSDAAAAAPAEGGVPEIADIPEMPMAPVPQTAAPVSDGPAWLWALSAIVQAAACVAMGALAWFLYQNTQVSYF